MRITKYLRNLLFKPIYEIRDFWGLSLTLIVAAVVFFLAVVIGTIISAVLYPITP